MNMLQELDIMMPPTLKTLQEKLDFLKNHEANMQKLITQTKLDSAAFESKNSELVSKVHDLEAQNMGGMFGGGWILL